MILSRAQAEERIVVTHDKDFGELAFRSRLPASCGVILHRLSGPGPDADNRRILDALGSRGDWAGHFSVVTDSRISNAAIAGRPFAAIGYMTDAVVYRPYATVTRPSLPELGSGTKTCKARDMQSAA